MMLSNQLQEDLRKLRVSSARRFGELAGVDANAIQSLADDVGAQYQRFQKRVQEEIADTGESTAKEHEHWVRANKVAIQRRFVGAIALPRPSCQCLPLFVEDTTESSSNSQCLGACLENEPHIGPEPNTAHPRVDVSSAGVGAQNFAETIVRFEFEFEPGANGNYCLLPTCQLNGYWLAWSWGSCNDDPAVSTARVEVEKSIQVFQRIDDFELPLALAVGGPPVYSVTHQVVDETNQGGGGSQSGFSFNGIPAFGVDLLGGDPVTVRVTCRVRASVEGFGRAIVDMGTSPNFYFRAPEVRWGPTICFA